MPKNDTASEVFRKKAYKVMTQLLFLFGFSAVAGALIGLWIDNLYGTKPWGIIVCLIISYILTWPFALKIKKKFEPEQKKYREEIEEPSEAEESKEPDEIITK